MSGATQHSGPVRYGPYPELTWPAVIVGYFLGAILALSIGYASLLLGFSIEGSELAAILGFGILRGIMGRRSIVENNINQTIASAVNGASSGMMFSVPALFILESQGVYSGLTDFSKMGMVFGCISGAIMGIAFIIPLRKQMIDYNRLTYPGGVAVATILKSPGAGMRKAWLLLGGVAISAILHLVVTMVGVSKAPLGEWLGLPEYMNVTFYISLLTVGTGFIAGRGGFYFVIGGFVCYWLLAPFMDMTGFLPAAATLEEAGQGVTDYLRLNMFRPVGIGMLIGGAMTGIVLALPLIISAVRSMQRAAKTKSELSQDELPVKLLYIAIAGAGVVLLLMAEYSTVEMTLWRGVAMAVLGVLWIWVSGIILSECIGRTNWSPLSGMTLIGVTLLIFVASGMSDPAAVVASVMVGGCMCVAMSQATDLMLDMKTGYMVGSRPRMQQIGQFLGTWLGPILVMILILVLHEKYTLGSEKLSAPQGQALASMISGILGGDVPVDKYIAGAGLGAILSASGIGGLGVLVGLGFYLPFYIVLTYTIGVLMRLWSDKAKGTLFSESVGIPIAAGFIVGEALVGVGAAFWSIFVG